MIGNKPIIDNIHTYIFIFFNIFVTESNIIFKKKQDEAKNNTINFSIDGNEVLLWICSRNTYSNRGSV